MKTKELLADSFRSLVLTMPFQKISIKMITDGAHVIRPTFYNYFQDKYEVIEFLFDQDIGSKVEVMIENDMELTDLYPCGESGNGDPDHTVRHCGRAPDQ